MNGVTDLNTRRDSYHHGDLRNALCDAATELARRGGPDAVVLREAARRVGVSATAAYRHFANHGDLMHAVKLRALDELADALQTAIDATEQDNADPGSADPRTADRGSADPRAADPDSADPRTADPGDAAVRSLYTAARAYLRFALSQTGLFRSAFCRPDGKPDDEWTPERMADRPAYSILTHVMDLLTQTGRLRPERRACADFFAWSVVHGLAMLILDGPLGNVPEPQREAVIDRTIYLAITGLLGTDDAGLI